MNASHMTSSSQHHASVAGGTTVFSRPGPHRLAWLLANARACDRARSAKNRRISGRPVDARAGQRGFAIDVDTIDHKGCVIIKREGLHSSSPVDMEAPYAAKDEFESLLESMCASTASSSRGGAPWTPPDIGSGDALDEIHKAHGT